MTKLPAPDYPEIGEDECLMCGSEDTQVFEAEGDTEETVRECFACGHAEVL